MTAPAEVHTINGLVFSPDHGAEVYDSELTQPWARMRWVANTLVRYQGRVATVAHHCERTGSCVVCVIAHLRGGITWRVCLRDKPVKRTCARHPNEFMIEWGLQWAEARARGESIRSLNARMLPDKYDRNGVKRRGR